MGVVAVVSRARVPETSVAVSVGVETVVISSVGVVVGGLVGVVVMVVPRVVVAVVTDMEPPPPPPPPLPPLDVCVDVTVTGFPTMIVRVIAAPPSTVMVITTLPSVTPSTRNDISESSGPAFFPCMVRLAMIFVAPSAAVPPSEMESYVPSGIEPESVVENTPFVETPTFFTSVSPLLTTSWFVAVFRSVAESEPSCKANGRTRFLVSNEKAPPGMAENIPSICRENVLLFGRSSIDMVTWSPFSILSGVTVTESAEIPSMRNRIAKMIQYRDMFTVGPPGLVYRHSTDCININSVRALLLAPDFRIAPACV